MFQKILNFIYPNKCILCGKLLYSENIENIDFACKNCKLKLEYYRSKLHRKNYSLYYFDDVFYSFKYQGIVRKLLLDFKFENKKYLYDFLSNDLAQRTLEYCLNNNCHFDYIIYVPISYKRYIERGYNQSYLIAKKISKITKIQLLPFSLFKIKNNERQSELSHDKRELNTKGVYKVNNFFNLKGKCLLLIDDIFTTGATANECSKVLKLAGAKKIVVATVAKA